MAGDMNHCYYHVCKLVGFGLETTNILCVGSHNMHVGVYSRCSMNGFRNVCACVCNGA